MTELAAADIRNSGVSMLAKDVAAVIFHIFTPFTTRRIPVALCPLSTASECLFYTLRQSVQ